MVTAINQLYSVFILTHILRQHHHIRGYGSLVVANHNLCHATFSYQQYSL